MSGWGVLVEQVLFAPPGTPLPRHVNDELHPAFVSEFPAEPGVDEISTFGSVQPVTFRRRRWEFALVVDLADPVAGAVRLCVPRLELRPDAGDAVLHLHVERPGGGPDWATPHRS